MSDTVVSDTVVSEWLAGATADARHDLSALQVSALLGGLAGHPGLMDRADRLPPAAPHRSWECLYRNPHVDVWMIAWTDGADTGWHDHDSSVGAMRVLDGTVTEERQRATGRHERRTVPAGTALTFDADHVHRITVAGPRAVTIHAYSPPLRQMREYRLDDLGALQRRTAVDDGSPVARAS